MDRIKSNTIEYMSSLIDDLYKSSLYHNIVSDQDLTGVIFPIHYLFDKYINKDIGNTIVNVNYIREKLGLDMLFNINNISNT